jgi:hypothetical protein
MALSYTPITELEAVNVLLSGIGEMPVSTIPTEDVTDASLAQDMIHRINREVQGMGLKCNTDYNYEISPDIDGYINIPTNALRVVSYYRYNDYAVRARKLYDRYNQTFEFDDKVYVNITYFLNFTDLPEHVRHYIVIKAARRFQSESVGSPALEQFTADDEFEAKAEFKRWEIVKQGSSMLDTGIGYKIMNRSA